MSESAILRGIAEVASEQLGRPVRLDPEQRLVEDLRLDSLTSLGLAIGIENRFRIRLDEGDEASVRTVGDLVAIVRRKLDAESGEP